MLQPVIAVFSPTGNCKKIAEAVKSALRGLNPLFLDVTRAQRRVPLALSPGQWLILIAPVYAHDFPDIVREWLASVSGSDIPATILAVYGNVSAGDSISRTAQLLEEHGIRTVSAAELVAPHSYNGRYVHLGVGRPSEQELEVLARFLQQSRSKAENPGASLKLPHRAAPMSLIPQGVLAHFAVCPPKADPALCSHCGICRTVCPVEAVGSDLSIGRKKCVRCLACVRVCRPGARKLRFRTPFPILFLNLFGRGEHSPRFLL